MADTAKLEAKIMLDVANFQQNSAKVKNEAKAVESRLEQMKVSAASALGKGIQTAANVGIAALNGMKTAILSITAASAGLFAYMVKEAGDARKILQDAARLNIDTTSYQQLTYAAQQYGIEQEKVADILKDTNDKIGDFILTGGGEAKDIFEKLKLDAADFIGLSPEKALQKIADAAQGLSAQDKTFLFEAIADEASLLLPLLDESGKKLDEIKQKMLSKGLILSENELQALENFKSGLNEIFAIIKGFSEHIAAYMAAPLQVLINEVNKLISGFGGMDTAAMAFSKNLVAGLGKVADFAAAVYKWWVEWEIKLIDLKALIFSLLSGTLKLGEAFLKYTPAGLATDAAAKLTTGESLSSRLEKERAVMDGILNELSDERAKSEQSIIQAQQLAEKVKTDIVSKMNSAIEQADADMWRNKASKYEASSNASDGILSRANYEAAQAQKAQEAAAKEAEKAAKAQESAAKKLSDAGDKLSSSNTESIIDRQYKSLMEKANAYNAERNATYKTPLESLKDLQSQAAREQAAQMPTLPTTATATPLNAPQVAKTLNITVSGGVDVNLTGADNSLAQSITGNSVFIQAFTELFNKNIADILRNTAQAVS